MWCGYWPRQGLPRLHSIRHYHLHIFSQIFPVLILPQTSFHPPRSLIHPPLSLAHSFTGIPSAHPATDFIPSATITCTFFHRYPQCSFCHRLHSIRHYHLHLFPQIFPVLDVFHRYSRCGCWLSARPAKTFHSIHHYHLHILSQIFPVLILPQTSFHPSRSLIHSPLSLAHTSTDIPGVGCGAAAGSQQGLP